MIDNTNDPSLRAYIEKERVRRRQEAAEGTQKSLFETPEANEINILLVQELKNINNNLHLIQRELKNINKTLDRRK